MVRGEFSGYSPEDPREFCIGADVVVGPVGVPGGDIFSFEVCRPRWPEKNEGKKPRSMRHVILIDGYDETSMKSADKDLLESVSGEGWPDIPTRLGRYMSWKFEDCHPARTELSCDMPSLSGQSGRKGCDMIPHQNPQP